MKVFWLDVWNIIKKICRKIANKNMWCKVRRWFLKILTIPSWLMVLLVIITIVSLCYVFINRMDKSLMAVVAYAISAYTLGTVCVAAPAMYRGVKRATNNSKTVNYVLNHKVTKKLRSDDAYREKFLLYQGMAMSMLFAGFKLVASWIYRSVWFGAVGVYYIVLTAIRYILIRYTKKSDEMSEDAVDNVDEEITAKIILEYRAYRLCGCLMIFANVAMGGMTVQMVVYDEGYKYPGIIIYVSAVYAFYSLTMAIINIIRYRKIDRPILSAAKAVNLTGALLSILALQTAMIAQFGGDTVFRRTMNSLTGGGIYLIVLTFAVLMIRKANKFLKEHKDMV